MKEVENILVEMRRCHTGCFKERESDVIWYLLEGDIHRIGGAAIISSDGIEEWYFKGKRHKSDGPSMILSKNKWYYYYGSRAFDEKEFYNPEWRRKIEIEEFL